jgi:RNA recognition motif-containing protein
MGKKVYVGGLSWGTDDHGLRAAFERFGEVEDARVVRDRDTGRSRGFGFVTYVDDTSVTTAVRELDGKELDGRTLKVSEAQEKPDRGGRSGGGSRGFRDRDPMGGSSRW